MDEPTNDLDIDTLELLQELVTDFSGTLLLVSHDRAFLDSVVTNLFVLEGNGHVQDFVGGYSDWVTYRTDRRQAAQRAKAPPPAPPKPVETAVKPAPARKRRSNNEQRELDALTAKLEKLEAEKATLAARIADPAFYTQDAAKMKAELARAAAVEAEIDTAFTRWAELEG